MLFIRTLYIPERTIRGGRNGNKGWYERGTRGELEGENNGSGDKGTALRATHEPEIRRTIGAARNG
jgi:hypothetical protein